MQALDRLLELADAHLAARRIARIAALRHVVIHRVIAPVELRVVARLVHRAVVVNRQQLNMRNAQTPDIVYAGFVNAVAVKRRRGFTKPQIPAAVSLGYAA